MLSVILKSSTIFDLAVVSWVEVIMQWSIPYENKRIPFFSFELTSWVDIYSFEFKFEFSTKRISNAVNK